MPPTPTFVFYCGNIILLTAYVILALTSARPGGVTGVQASGPLLKWSGVVFFFLAAMLHLDMAIHIITGAPFFDDGTNRIAWDFSLIVFAKMLSVVFALFGVRADVRKRRRTVHPI